MSFGKTTLRRWLPAAALVLALLCPLPVFAAQAGAEIPVTVRTDGAACDTVYTVEITPLDNAPAPAQTSVQVKGGGTAYFTGLTFDAPGDYRYKLSQVKGCAADTTYDGRTYTVTVRVMTAADREIPKGSETVDLTAGAYDSLYDNYIDIQFEALVPASEAGPVSFFDNAVFIGDSISMTLEAYCGASGALGQAKFLCAGSMSPTNMLTGKILPEYPKGSGQKPAIQDSVAATGAKYVYVMLGMDNIAYGIERSTNDYMTILKNILDKNPDVQIIIQSVTPMADKSKSYSEKLNNGKINEFNETMKAYCEENKWYYVNVAEAFRDENGFLKKEYCSDYNSMGMHFTYEGAKVWVNYLLTHIPARLL